MSVSDLTYAQYRETRIRRQPASYKARDQIENIVIVEILK